MTQVYFFNPETDILLGLDCIHYTPNRRIKIMQEQFSLLPALYASKDSYILVPPEVLQRISHLPFYDLVELKNIRLLGFSSHKKAYKNEIDELKQLITRKSDIYFRPWGWNKELLFRLSRYGVPSKFLPSQKDIEALRTLSHRRTTIEFFNQYEEVFPNILTPIEIKDLEHLKKFVDEYPEFVLKAPWSSSGRGVLLSPNHSKEEALAWGFGTIRAQGSVIGEKHYKRSLDFASEWEIHDSNVKFTGLSLFKSSGRGKYAGNLLYSQEEILKILPSEWNNDILTLQQEFITEKIAPLYSGPLGIDMLIDYEGKLNPCVEINLRNTMGHVAIHTEREIAESPSKELSSLLKHYFPNHILSLPNLMIISE